jgi:CRP/FNR family transcriptional regulator, cyclic AMP receptor protein
MAVVRSASLPLDDQLVRPPARARALMAAARVWTADEDVLFAEGVLPEHVGVVERGVLAAIATLPAGRQVMVGLLGPGDVTGQAALTRGGPQTDRFLPEVRAFGQATVRLLDPEPLARSLVDPDVAAWLLERTHRRTEAAERRLAAALTMPVQERVRSALLELAAIRSTPALGGARRIEVPLTQDRIASMTGATRESVNRALGTLRRTGEVTVDARRSYLIRSKPHGGSAPGRYDPLTGRSPEGGRS